MKNRFLTKEGWAFLCLSVLCAGMLLYYVELTPHVDYDVFFSKEDPSYKADLEISRLFRRDDAQIIISVIGDIQAADYQKKIKEFGDFLMDINQVADVRSIQHGPRSLIYAMQSPFWKRLLIPDDLASSNLIVVLKPGVSLDDFPAAVSKIELLKQFFDAEEFRIHISGFPYIVELIRLHLSSDLRIFTGMAILLFGVVVLLVFHSWRVLLGMVVACVNAAVLTLLATQLFDIKIGILTANLTTIVFVLTLSHIVFLIFNWKHIRQAQNPDEAVSRAVRMTFPASFWAMFTTLLGFVSLFFVQAKSIRELGAAGAIGTVIAFLMAYGVYPSFLRIDRPVEEETETTFKNFSGRMFALCNKNQGVFIVLIAGLVLATAGHLRSLNTDPSLISFFAPSSPIAQGLKYIDEHGGSNPLVLVVADKDRQPLYTKSGVERVRDLHLELERHKDVGVVLSMPVLVDEARRSHFFSFLKSNRSLLRSMEKPRYGGIAKSFVMHEGQYALFLLRMKEEGRTAGRVEVIGELEDTVRRYQFLPHLTGGIYALQGHLSQHIASSLVWGLSRLIMIFFIIAFIVCRSFRGAVAMMASISVIPLCILGPIGLFRVPLDMITAPASNLAISMGIDAMIHMMHAYRRLRKENPQQAHIWTEVKKKLWEPVLTSMFIVCAGFGIFFFSSFPPTQRFGGSIVWGALVSAACALSLFPLLAGHDRPRVSVTKLPEKARHLKDLRLLEKRRQDFRLN